MADTVKQNTITVTAELDGVSVDINFNKDTATFNQYINEIGAGDKIKPSFNYLMRSVTDASKDDLKAIILDGQVPKGMVVMNIVGIVAYVMNGGFKLTLKK
jgi:chemotaxis response regulator CheB